MIRAGAVCLLPLALAACDQNMVQQPRYDPYEAAELFPDGQAMQPPPGGTIDLGTPARQAAAAAMPAIDEALLKRGRERYGIYCSMCHGEDGRGNGVVPSRGYPHPPSFLAPRLRAVADQHIFDVITEGYGVMYSYADRVPPADRWAIVAWIRVLQRAQQGDGDEA
ncbi:conserved hypothetical protein [Altererythrobacter sp. B11]|uniref:c-type cytochrome n=1 Tax=Altererythrobacter sp. B11 TaxID=2060312 RepID=UPI000DC71A2A|nr:cytochrome c [Altererythrobacter sp. B11]BBC72773.1 conserved hypothetical protein [Altererythrobacter sp. B11]